MTKTPCWSFSTTMRNPERASNFLRACISLNGKPYDEEHQCAYQVCLIQNLLYKPTDLTEQEQKHYKYDSAFSPKQALEIFERQDYKDPDMRGRQSMNPLRKLGLITTTGTIQITALGERLLTGELTVSTVFKNFLAKWAFPNPMEVKCKASVSPLLLAYNIIRHCNKTENPVGCRASTFRQILPLVSSNVQEYGAMLAIAESRAASKEASMINVFLDDLGLKPTDKVVNNAHDYGDQFIRMLRLSRWFIIRGKGYFIDVNPDRMDELEAAIAVLASRPTFANTAVYEAYLTNLNSPVVPWMDETAVALRTSKVLNILKSTDLVDPAVVAKGLKTVNTQERLESLETILRTVRRKQENKAFANNPVVYQEAKEGLTELTKKRCVLPYKPPVAFEYFAARALQYINDAEDITPHFTTSDDLLPLGHAPGNKPDLTAVYTAFALTVEVTLTSGVQQNSTEGQSVRRHHVEEIARVGKSVYTLFIAPTINKDTFESFRVPTLDGVETKIVPLRLSTFLSMLDVVHSRIASNTPIKSCDLHRWLQQQIARYREPAVRYTEWEDAVTSSFAAL